MCPRAWVNDGNFDGEHIAWLEENVITVAIPDYEDVWTGLSQEIDLTSDGFGTFNSIVKNPDGSLTFGLDQLQPGRVNLSYESSIASNSFHNITNIFFTGSEYYAVIAKESGHPSSFTSLEVGLSNNTTPPSPIFSGDWGCIVIPFSGITVPDNVPEVTFRVSLDLTGIIEVYDAKTPAIINDDIMVIANNFWERFNLSALY